MRMAVLLLDILLGAGLIWCMVHGRLPQLPEEKGRTGPLLGVAYVLTGSILLLVVLLCIIPLLVSWQMGLMGWLLAACFLPECAQLLLWRIRWQEEGFAWRDGWGVERRYAWQEVLGAERTTVYYGKGGRARVVIVHLPDRSLVLEERRDAAFLVELENRRGALPPLRPRRGPWQGRVKDVARYRMDNALGLGLGGAMLVMGLDAKIGIFIAAAAFVLLYTLLRMVLGHHHALSDKTAWFFLGSGNSWV